MGQKNNLLWLFVEQNINRLVLRNPGLEGLISCREACSTDGKNRLAIRIFCINVGDDQRIQTKVNEEGFQSVGMASTDLKPGDVAASQVLVLVAFADEVRNKDAFS